MPQATLVVGASVAPAWRYSSSVIDKLSGLSNPDVATKPYRSPVPRCRDQLFDIVEATVDYRLLAGSVAIADDAVIAEDFLDVAPLGIEVHRR